MGVVKLEGATLGRGGRLFVVGIGPGRRDWMAPAAVAAVGSADLIVGYRPYVEMVKDLVRRGSVLESGMRMEMERAMRAVAAAVEGKTVAVVSGGDAGVYGMAGPVHEAWEETGRPCEIETIPGVSAVNAAAALLGAPIAHDFAVISLSDALTPWELIERRIDAAAAADFVVAFYNPRSSCRAAHLETARAIMLRHRAPSTPVGIAWNAGRDGEQVVVTDLAGMTVHPVDMSAIVLVGNSETRVVDGRMITPRGYRR